VVHSVPRAVSSRSSCASPSASRSVATKRAPSAANTSAVARPIPFAAPVMTADLPSSRPIPGRPLLRVLDGPRLADDGDLDLARVGQAVLDRLYDVGGEPAGRQVVDLVGTDEDPDLAPGLNGERAVDAGEALGDRLEILEALDVRLHGLAASARAGRRDRVGDLDDRR